MNETEPIACKCHCHTNHNGLDGSEGKARCKCLPRCTHCTPLKGDWKEDFNKAFGDMTGEVASENGEYVHNLKPYIIEWIESLRAKDKQRYVEALEKEKRNPAEYLTDTSKPVNERRYMSEAIEYNEGIDKAIDTIKKL